MTETISAEDEFIDNINITDNTLEVETETWDDPGEYPSGAGGRALPSYSYPILSGSLKFVTWISDNSVDADKIKSDPLQCDHIVSEILYEYIPDYDETGFYDEGWDPSKFTPRVVTKEIEYKDGKYFFTMELEFDE